MFFTRSLRHVSPPGAARRVGPPRHERRRVRASASLAGAARGRTSRRAIRATAAGRSSSRWRASGRAPSPARRTARASSSSGSRFVLARGQLAPAAAAARRRVLRRQRALVARRRGPRSSTCPTGPRSPLACACPRRGAPRCSATCSCSCRWRRCSSALAVWAWRRSSENKPYVPVAAPGRQRGRSREARRGPSARHARSPCIVLAAGAAAYAYVDRTAARCRTPTGHARRDRRVPELSRRRGDARRAGHGTERLVLDRESTRRAARRGRARRRGR